LKKDISTHTTDYKLPTELPDDYKFIGGKMEDPFGGAIDLSSEALQVEKESLINRAKKTGEKIIWEHIEPEKN
jgi:hypothetical protein